MQYPIVIHKDTDSDFGVSFPDLPGCITAGSTIEEAMIMAVEAAELYIEDVLIENEPLPQPSAIELCINNPDFVGGILWSFVDVDLTKLSEVTTVDLVVPDQMLREIDVYAEKENQTRSAFLITSAMERIHRSAS